MNHDTAHWQTPEGQRSAGDLLDVRVAQTVAQLRTLGVAPTSALILGSGWTDAVQGLQVEARMAYADLPAFPEISVTGHGDRLVIGQLHGRRVAVLTGRRHTYEGGRPNAMLGAILSLAAWGVSTLIQTAAAGSLDLKIRPGELVLIEDHLNLSQASPLWSCTGDRRFVDMSHAYHPELRGRALFESALAGLSVHEGIYAWAIGPQFETPAEVRMLRALGGHAVGMSVVPETIAARYAGMRVLACALITNMAAGMGDTTLNHELTLERSQLAQDTAERALKVLVEVAQPA
jgi:purine-nucleoside phosphorylase